MPPSPFVIQWVPRLAVTARPEARALDLAMGRGRHVEALTRAGFRVFGVDRSLEALQEAMSLGAARGADLHAWCADLTAYPLPKGWFDLVLVTRYLDRNLFPVIREAVAPGGVVLYETFTRHQLVHGRGPTSPEHLLEPNELLMRFDGFEILHHEEQLEPEARASLVARRPR